MNVSALTERFGEHEQAFQQSLFGFLDSCEFTWEHTSEAGRNKHRKEEDRVRGWHLPEKKISLLYAFVILLFYFRASSCRQVLSFCEYPLSLFLSSLFALIINWLSSSFRRTARPWSVGIPHTLSLVSFVTTGRQTDRQLFITHRTFCFGDSVHSVCASFNDAVSNSRDIASNDTINE